MPAPHCVHGATHAKCDMFGTEAERSPERRSAELLQSRIARRDRQAQLERLRDEHPIERIAMVPCKPAGTMCLPRRDSDSLEPFISQHFGYSMRDGGYAGQLPDPRLRCNLPYGCCTDDDSVRLVDDRRADSSRHPLVTRQPPQECMRIEQEPHDDFLVKRFADGLADGATNSSPSSHARSSSSGNGSKNASSMVICPR